MGVITLLTDKFPDLLPMQNRSAGDHVSEIIHSICIREGHYAEGGQLNPAKLALGNAWERSIIQGFSLEFPDRYIQPGELEKDNIYGTPDLVDILDLAIEEIKCSWLSSNHDIDSVKFWKFWCQIKAYCYMLGSQVGRLHVVFVNGDYKYDGEGTQYRCWEQRFSRQELIENWVRLKSELQRKKGKG